jgi:hypothetical protein
MGQVWWCRGDKCVYLVGISGDLVGIRVGISVVV